MSNPSSAMNEMVSLNWLDWERADLEQRHMCGRTLSRHDISKIGGKPKMSHIKQLIKDKYGERSSKIDDSDEQNFVRDSHEKLRFRIKNESAQLVKYLYCSLAKTVGITSQGGGKFSFVNIFDDILQKWDEASFLRAFFVIRAAWDDNPRWILTAEKLVMNRLCLQYENNFETTMNNFGCIASIISSEKTRKLRDFNDNLRSKCGRMIKVSMGLEKGVQKMGRRPPCTFSQQTMVVEHPKSMKNMDKKYHQAPKRNSEIITENDGRVNLLKCPCIPSSFFFEAKNTFTLVDYFGFKPTIPIKKEKNGILNKEQKTGDKQKHARSSRDKNRRKLKKLSMTKKEAPQLSEDDSDSNFSKTTKESNELTLNIESNIDPIFNDEDDVIGLQEERTLEINETVPKIHVNTKSLQEIEDFKKKLMKEKEDSENLQDLKLIEEVSTLSI